MLEHKADQTDALSLTEKELDRIVLEIVQEEIERRQRSFEDDSWIGRLFESMRAPRDLDSGTSMLDLREIRSLGQRFISPTIDLDLIDRSVARLSESGGLKTRSIPYDPYTVGIAGEWYGVHIDIPQSQSEEVDELTPPRLTDWIDI